MVCFFLHLSSSLLHLQDFLGRWSVIPVLAVAACLWNKWRARQLEGKLEQCKLEEVSNPARRPRRQACSRRPDVPARAPLVLCTYTNTHTPSQCSWIMGTAELCLRTSPPLLVLPPVLIGSIVVHGE